MAETLIKVKHLKKYFKLGNEKISKAKVRYLHAVDDVSFEIKKGEIFGIIGESGSGKSTIGKCILRLIESDSGQVLLNGEDVTQLSKKELKKMRPNMQMVFQNPLASFNPKKKLGDAFREYGKFLGIPDAEFEKKMKELLEYINLADDVMTRLPKELSGGQLQRLAFARAILSEPDFLLADEPVSALDVSVQAQILNLMLDLKEQKGQTMLFISHDLNVVKHICERVAVVYLGVIVEMGDMEEIYHNAKHPYTKALIAAKPKEHPLEDKERILLEGDIPNAIDVKEGCRFAGRCTRYKEGLCDHRTPKLKDIGDGHFVACHYALDTE